jgi:hypothetical protein
MFRRQPGKPDAKDASANSRRAAIADSAWSAQDRLRSGSERALRAGADSAGSLLERVLYFIRAKLLWPLQDRTETMAAPARALSFAAVVLLAAGAGVAGLVWAAPDGPHRDAPTTVAETSDPLPATPPSKPQPQAEPTLHGATPVFKPRPEQAAASEVDPAEAIVGSAPGSAGSDSGSKPEAPSDTETLAATSSGTKGAELKGPPAGPKAISVAREFADAFVLYETGGTDSAVREAFGTTATPALAKALLDRPPRLPANVDVPKAKVLNIVPAPSRGSVFPLSVSLLRVGVTSELRLDMEWLKGKRWRVTNVLG